MGSRGKHGGRAVTSGNKAGVDTAGQVADMVGEDGAGASAEVADASLGASDAASGRRRRPGDRTGRHSAAGADWFAWFRELPGKGRRAFVGAFLGFGLDSYDFWVLPLGLAAIAGTFGLDTGQTGLLSTTTLVFSAIGGVAAGVLADRLGRVRTLMITVVTYAVFTALCGLAQNYETLLVFRALQGLGFGGEWATGAILVAEYTSARHRGRVAAVIQSSWAVGWGMAVIAYTVVFNLVDPDLAWRILFFTGALPALLVVYLRRGIEDAPVFTRHKAEARGSLRAIFRPDLIRTTAFASLLATGCQGGYYTLATWLPAFLSKERGLTVIGTGGYMFFLISGAFLGYLTGGYFTDRLGRKNTFRLFAVLSAVLMTLYTQLPPSLGAYVMYLGFPLGFCSSAIFSGFGAYLAELYPSRARGAGPGFTYNFGRAVGAFFPTVIGFVALRYGIGGAMGFGALAYGVTFVSLFGLPETRDRELS
ncbi:MFS transporter [Actinokineospora iranica]|uniref:Predicted arabinose efflux permease, MFS family n=1 Tax=Actinokineospora iranica TaxID=1271860 RepID=A0A1G6P4L8_9PSEU|nr:MFS transporter [Actinokineospora iranica]SDC74446.1 Predicted arabinose efflux permease, MFS family [Actinokineospora iranica]